MNKPNSIEKELRQHQDLRKDVDHLRSFLQQPRPGRQQVGANLWATTLTKDLFALHWKISQHFRDEESSGLFDAMAMAHPRVTSQVRGLKSQHGRILGELRGVLSDAMALASPGTSPRRAVGDRVLSVLDEFTRHESLETRLMTDLIYEDLGSAG